MSQEWKEIIVEDTNYLEETLNIPNVCLVKKMTPTGELIPSYITFNYWFNDDSVGLKAIPILEEEAMYDIYFKSTLVLKHTELDDIVNKLNKFHAVVQKDYAGNITKIELKKGSKKKGKGKKKCSDTDNI